MELNSDFAEALCNAGGCCIKLGRFEEAVTLCERALVVNPDYADAHFNLNSALRCAGRHQEALARTWAQLCPAEPSVVRAVAASSPRRAIAPADTTFVCVKWGKKYGSDYVNALYDGVVRNVPCPSLHFVCLTDDPAGLRDEVRVQCSWLRNELAVLWTSGEPVTPCVRLGL